MQTLKTIGLLSLSFLIVPLFLALGYAFRVARSAALGVHYPPKYKDWGGLLFDGFRFFAVYFIIAFVSNIAVFALFRATVEISIGLAAIVFIILSIAVPWVMFAFLLAFLGSNSVAEAFSNGEALELLKSWFYFKSLLLFVGLVLIMTTLIIVASITIIGGIAALFYSILVYAAYWGYIYYRAVEEGIVSPAVGRGQTTNQSQAARQPRR